MKRSVKIASAIAGAAVLVALGIAIPTALNRPGAFASSKNTGSASTAAPVTITLGTWGGAQENQQLMQIIDKINQKYKGKFVIEDYNVPGGNYDQKLNTEFAAGTAPDIFYVDDSLAQTYASEGVLLDLTQYINEFKSKALVANPANYYPNTLVDVRYSGHYYALPWIAQPVVMYYNPKLFQQAHLPIPSPNWTWQDFMRDAKKLTNPSKGIYGYLQSNGWPPVEMYIWSYGGDIYNASKTKALLNTPADIKGLTLMADMVKEGVVPPLAKLANVDIEDLFRQGRVAMFAGGAADGNYDTNGFTAKIQQMPMGTTHATDLYIADLAINAHSKVPKEDLYLAYTALLDGIDHWKIVPPVKQYAANLQDIVVPGAPGNHTPSDRIQPILESLKYAKVIPVVKNMANYWNIMSNDIYQPLLLGQMTPQQAAQKAEQDLNANLK